MAVFKSNSPEKKQTHTFTLPISSIFFALLTILIAFPVVFTSDSKTKEIITNTSNIEFEKYQNFEALPTTQEYQELCKKLATFADCDQAYITCDNARVVQKVNGEYISTNVFTNIFWVWTESGFTTENESYSLEDLGVIYTEYDCTTADTKNGYIIPEKNISKSCRLSPEVEKALGYTTEEIVDIYIRRFDVNREDYYPHSKFKTIPCE